MVEEIITKSYTYKTLDGVVFGNKESAVKHENSLPRLTRYILIKKITPEQLKEVGYYQIGYEYHWETYETVSGGGFLRPEEDYEITHDNCEITILKTLSGSYNDVLRYACDINKWWDNSHRFIKKIEIESL